MTPLPGIVLAAGASSRMGRPKALLPVDEGGASFARVVCDTLTSAGIHPVVLVTRSELRAPLSDAVPGAMLVVNASPERGQLSSLLTGLDALGTPEAVLVTLVDLPLVRPSTVEALVRAWRESGAPLVRPTCQGRRGHPVIFGSPLLRDLRGADPDAGAKPIVRRYHPTSVDVAVDDPGTTVDVDTPESYMQLLADPATNPRNPPKSDARSPKADD